MTNFGRNARIFRIKQNNTFRQMAQSFVVSAIDYVILNSPSKIAISKTA